MSSKRRSLPRKKPDQTAQHEIEAELPELEPLDDLPELPLLEADDDVDDGPVKIELQPSQEVAFEHVLVIEVPAMDKAAVQAAVTPALARAATRHGAGLRWRKVLVRFAGEAMIGSAIKQVVAEALAAHRPSLVVVRRGFGDETVHQAETPKLPVVATPGTDEVAVAVDTGNLELADVLALLPAELARLASDAGGKRFAFTFRGAVKADAAVREVLQSRLRAAGAKRIAVGARVLFDQELLDAIAVRQSDKGFVLTIAVPADAALFGDVLALFAAERAAPLRGQAVRLWFAKGGAPAEVAAAVAMCRDAGAARISLGEDGQEDVVWPSLIRGEVGKEVVLVLDAGGRNRAGVLRAFARELGAHADAARGKVVTIDWPAGFVLDAEVVDGALAAAVAQLAPKRLCCTVGGELKEPFAPAPFVVQVDGAVQVLRVDVDAGKPAELTRAFERRQAQLAPKWRGQSVRVVLAGDAATSRTLLRTLCAAIEAAGAMRLEVDDHGAIDVLLPPMLTVSQANGGQRISALAGERSDAQQELALARELDAAGVGSGATVRVVPSPLDAQLIAALVKRGVGEVILDGNAPVRVHPALFTFTAGKGKAARLLARPSGDAAMDLRQLQKELPGLAGGFAGKDLTIVWPAGELPAALHDGCIAAGVASLHHDQGDGVALQVHPPVEVIPVEVIPVEPEPAAVAAAPIPTAAPAAAASAPVLPGVAGEVLPGLVDVLARNDQGVPPLAVLGIAAGEGDQHAANVAASLTAMQAAFAGRAILLVVRNGGADVPVRSDSMLVRAARAAVGATAAATLVFRGPDAQGRPHFSVVQSRLRALPVGSAFHDPRAK